MNDVLKGLNKAQKEAVTTTNGYVRVVAGAGSGKTRALTHRYAYLVNECNVDPRRILCLTFTVKAATEMEERVRTLVGNREIGRISTFHSLCAKILRNEAGMIGFPSNYEIIDTRKMQEMLRAICKDMNVKWDDLEQGINLKDIIPSMKEEMSVSVDNEPPYYERLIKVSKEELYDSYKNSVRDLFNKSGSIEDALFNGYLYYQRRDFGLDYTDLQVIALHLLKNFKYIREWYQEKFQYIMVDEFQDVDKLQYEIIKILSEHHKNLFVVGDPDQTIYTWRGADVKYLINFCNDFPGTKTILMNENYRSTPQILSVVNSLIEKNKDRIKKDLVAKLPDGKRVVRHHARTQEEEAAWIAEKIIELHEDGVEYDDIAVLYRMHFVARSLEESFRRRSIPYIIYKGINFFNRAEIKDIVAYLRLIVFHDDESFRRIVNTPRRGVGEKKMQKIEEYANTKGCLLYDAFKEIVEKDQKFATPKMKDFIVMIDELINEWEEYSLASLVEEILERSGYEEYLRAAAKKHGDTDRLDNLKEFQQAVYDYRGSLQDFLMEVALMSEDAGRKTEGKVKLMTIHSAKGLEFRNVFLYALNQGILPSSRAYSSDALEEERRLAFVAMSRAQDELFLTDSEGSTFDFKRRRPSEFYEDIDEDLVVNV